jgi:hypothetical protein
MDITNKFYEWKEVGGGVWGTIRFNTDGSIGCHNTYNERFWNIQTIDDKEYIYLVGDSGETAWIELSDQKVMYGTNTEGKAVSLRRYGGKTFKRTVENAFAMPDLADTIKNLGVISHNSVVPTSLSRWIGRMEYFIGLQQNPIEFSEYLNFLTDKQIDQYLEIGTFCGGTFVATMEWLKKCGRKPFGMAFDVGNRESTFAYANDFGGCEIHNVNSTSVNFDLLLGDKQFDLAFIDGDHNYEGVKSDWEKMKTRSRFISFHDIRYAHGVVQLWKEIVAAGYQTKEFVYESRPLGIGVVIL